MLTESREAMGFHKQEQILALASLSSPHFDANPFLLPGAMCRFAGLNSLVRRVVSMAPAPRLWESAGYSNQVYLMLPIRLEMRF
jgi:hypothetical protein